MKIFDKILGNIVDKIRDSILSIGIIYPPCFPDVFIWHTGYVENNIYLPDYATAFTGHPLQMVNGPCITLDGSVVELNYPGHGSIISSEGTSTLDYDGTDITGTAGTMYNVVFSDGHVLPCIGKTSTINPTVIYDIYGDAATITANDYVAVWGGSQDTYFHEAKYGYWYDVSGRYPYAHSGATRVENGWNYSMNGYKFIDPVDSAIVAMDTDHFFINTDGESLIIYHGTVEELSGELQTNNYFTTDLSGYSITTNWNWESPGVARHITGSVIPLTSSTALTDAIEYEITITVGGTTTGTITPAAGSGAVGTSRYNGTFTERLTCAGSTDLLLIPTTDFDGWVDDISVRKVDPLVNNNDKYFFSSEQGKGLICTENILEEPCLGDMMVYMDAAEWLTYDGEIVTYNGENIWVRI